MLKSQASLAKALHYLMMRWEQRLEKEGLAQGDMSDAIVPGRISLPALSVGKR